MQQIRGNHYVRISEDGYYIAPIGCSWLRLGYKPNKDDFPDDECAFGQELGFDFDPKTEPPTILEDSVYWELQGSKVVVVLAHESANEKVAGYYGYLDKFRAFTAVREEFKQRMNVAHQANEVQDETKRQKQANTLRQALLH